MNAPLLQTQALTELDDRLHDAAAFHGVQALGEREVNLEKACRDFMQLRQ